MYGILTALLAVQSVFGTIKKSYQPENSMRVTRRCLKNNKRAVAYTLITQTDNALTILKSAKKSIE